jgi:hypothetical protein
MAEPQEATEAAERRAFAAGQIDARLAGHDEHFARINGSIERLADEMHLMNLVVQRLADDAKANEATVIKTAAALKDADIARREKSDSSWTPFQRGIAVVVAATAVIGLYLRSTGRL